MMNPLLARAVGALLWLTASGLALAQSGTPEAQPSSTKEQLSLQGFGANNPACLEWNDACATCLREAGGDAHCSTPGIACQPKEIVCARLSR